MNIRSTVIGSTMLVVLLTAGAAQSLSGSNTVYTDDIVAGQVMSSDLAANAVSGSKIYPNSVTSADIAANGVGASELGPNAVNSSKVADNSITGADILDNSMTGLDINESTLELPAGPRSFGFSSNSSPFESPEVLLNGGVDLTLQSRGHPVVLATAQSVTLTCSAAANCTNIRIALYLEGEGVAGSGMTVPDMPAGSSATYNSPTLFGVWGHPQPAGNYSITVGVNAADSGQISAASASNLRVTAFG